jgi:hypothetical protein
MGSISQVCRSLRLFGRFATNDLHRLAKKLLPGTCASPHGHGKFARSLFRRALSAGAGHGPKSEFRAWISSRGNRPLGGNAATLIACIFLARHDRTKTAVPCGAGLQSGGYVYPICLSALVAGRCPLWQERSGSKPLTKRNPSRPRSKDIFDCARRASFQDVIAIS